MKEYRIKSILHTGTMGPIGTPRKDGRYPLRIGRVVEFEMGEYPKNQPLWIQYLRKADGSDYSNKILKTSPLRDIYARHKESREYIYILTENSFYELEEIKKGDREWTQK